MKGIGKWMVGIGVVTGLTIPIVGNADSRYQSTFHSDGRLSPKIFFEPPFTLDPNLAEKEQARQFLLAHQQQFQLPVDFENLALVEVKESLLSRHYIFQQSVNKIAVEGGKIIVSISLDGKKINRVFNNIFPQTEPVVIPDKMMRTSDALDLAWEDLEVRGELISAPTIELVYLPQADGQYRLVYKTQTNVKEPFGYWEHKIDVITGEIISRRATQITRLKQASPKDKKTIDKPIISRQEAVRKFNQQQKLFGQESVRSQAEGKALIFDPDPRTVLQRETLEDGEPAETFEPTYVEGILHDITQQGDQFLLEGPWVKIVDNDPPNAVPVTTSDGQWMFKRGQGGFNDAMTYYHVDMNQRYMQSLGFVDEKGIQFGSISADANGAGGQDNSFYSPSTNSMSFGHGCVDDNEDVDVILHEYGHAIQYDINSDWGGGDTGAMGEGFGDYWAASYSVSTPNGMNFHPEWVFTWDGHNACWAGRYLDKLEAMYDKETQYFAHERFDGFISDELWSTPLFQSLLALIEEGQTREEVDTIILESHFGLGAGLTMADMANVTVATAARLYPDGPHASVFYEKFAAHNILALPLSLGDVSYQDASGDGVILPGEKVSVQVGLLNTSGSTLTGVSAVLNSEQPTVELVVDSADYPDIEANKTQVGAVPFELLVKEEHQCGVPLALALNTTYSTQQEEKQAFSASLPVGKPIITRGETVADIAIPDNNAQGVTSTLSFESDAVITEDSISVDLSIEHTYVSDLIIGLTSPSGKTVILWDNAGGGSDDIEGRLPDDFTPADSFSLLVGEPLNGTWTLSVKDTASQDVGKLNRWAMFVNSGYDCQTAADED